MAKPETLKKFIESLTDKVCEHLIEVVILKKDQRFTIRVKASDEALETIRSDALKQFKASTLERIQNVIEVEKVNEKLVSLHEWRDNNRKKAVKGWRPTGDPAKDSYGERRPVLMEHLTRLENLKAELTERICQMEQS